jgi:hypothetical protein
MSERLSSLIPVLEHLIQRVKGLNALSLGAIIKGFSCEIVRDEDGKRKPTTKAYLLIEQAYRLCRTHAQFLKDSLGLLLGLRLNSCMYHCCFIHNVIVSLMQHIVNNG